MQTYETKAYMIEVLFWDEVKDEEDSIRYITFAKDTENLEAKVKLECGESYRGIVSIQCLIGTIPL